MCNIQWILQQCLHFLASLVTVWRSRVWSCLPVFCHQFIRCRWFLWGWSRAPCPFQRQPLHKLPGMPFLLHFRPSSGSDRLLSGGLISLSWLGSWLGLAAAFWNPVYTYYIYVYIYIYILYIYVYICVCDMCVHHHISYASLIISTDYWWRSSLPVVCRPQSPSVRRLLHTSAQIKHIMKPQATWAQSWGILFGWSGIDIVVCLFRWDVISTVRTRRWKRWCPAVQMWSSIWLRTWTFWHTPAPIAHAFWPRATCGHSDSTGRWHGRSCSNAQGIPMFDESVNAAGVGVSPIPKDLGRIAGVRLAGNGFHIACAGTFVGFVLACLTEKSPA